MKMNILYVSQVAAKVCKRWREAVGSCGKLWSNSSLQINSHNISPVLTLMGSGMLSRLRSVKVEKVRPVKRVKFM